MPRFAFFLLAVAAFAADDPWTKVKELKSGTEIRVVKKGAAQPVVGKFDEANDENLVLVVKNEQTAILKENVERLDYRPSKPGGRIVKESKTTNNDPAKAAEPRAGMNAQPVDGGSSTSSTVSFQGKPDFETLYRRPPGASKNR
jgi:hypothetical protein